MATIIGTVGYLDPTTGRGVIHPDAGFLQHGISVVVTPEGLAQSEIGETVRSSHRVTFVVGQGQEGPQAFDIKAYEGAGIAA